MSADEAEEDGALGLLDVDRADGASQLVGSDAPPAPTDPYDGIELSRHTVGPEFLPVNPPADWTFELANKMAGRLGAVYDELSQLEVSINESSLALNMALAKKHGPDKTALLAELLTHTRSLATTAADAATDLLAALTGLSSAWDGAGQPPTTLHKAATTALARADAATNQLMASVNLLAMRGCDEPLPVIEPAGLVLQFSAFVPGRALLPSANDWLQVPCPQIEAPMSKAGALPTSLVRDTVIVDKYTLSMWGSGSPEFVFVNGALMSVRLVYDPPPPRPDLFSQTWARIVDELNTRLLPRMVAANVTQADLDVAFSVAGAGEPLMALALDASLPAAKLIARLAMAASPDAKRRVLVGMLSDAGVSAEQIQAALAASGADYATHALVATRSKKKSANKAARGRRRKGRR